MDDIDVNGVTLRVHQAGDPADPTVVLSHGFPNWLRVATPDGPLADAGYHVMPPTSAVRHLVVADRDRAYGIVT